MKRSTIAVYCISIFLLASCYNSQDISTATPSPQVPPQTSEILSDLNEWNAEEMDVFECHEDPDRVASGETGGWIIAHKRILKDLGVHIRWNCEHKAYEIVQEENLTPICGC